jgi:tripartite-type tricarboxylate transporter receptor subunit TctC
MHPKKVICAAAGACFAAIAAVVTAQSAYPAKPVRIVVPYPPGGGNDTLARIFGQKLSEQMGQQFVVENRPGAGTIVGTSYVARQAVPDGYTILLSSIATHAFAPHLYAKPGYDAIRDFQPLTLLAISPTIVVVNPSMPVKTLKELIALAKSRPGEIGMATAGTGSASHMLGMTFVAVTGVKVTEIPYKGGGPSHIGTITGEAQMIVDPAASVMPMVKSGRLRPLAVVRDTRLPDLSNVPTHKEAGLPRYDTSAWYSMHAPAKTPPDIVARLHKELVRAINAPDIRDKLKDLGSDPGGNTPEEFGQFVLAEHARYGKLIKEMGIKAD